MATTFTHTLIYELVTLFVILDPVSTIPIFLAATLGLARNHALKVGAYAVSISFVVLLVFIAGGQFLLNALHIPMPSFQLAGAMLTVVLLTDNNTRSFAEQALTAAELAVCLASLFGIYATASFLYRVLGRGGIEVVSRVFGLVVASIAVHNMIVAIKLSFNLVP